MTLPDDVAAIREGVAYSRLDDVSYIRIRGGTAYAALDALFPSALKMRDGQLLHTMLLTDDARPFADAYLCWDDEEFFILAEGPPSAVLAAWLRENLRGTDIVVEDCSETHAILALDGPYAWELLGLLVDPEAIGLPYLTFYHHGDSICYRAGKTGEYGYGIIARRDEAERLEKRLVEIGRAFNLRRVGRETLEQCALENWFFNIRREGAEAVTPIELQLQWRVSYQKSFAGSDALSRRRRDGAKQRLTSLLMNGEIARGDIVSLEGKPVGRIVNAGFSHVRAEWMALALIDVAWAYPGIASFAVAGRAGTATARSVSPPVLNNRSLSVSPQLHSYATRQEYPMPDLVRR